MDRRSSGRADNGHRRPLSTRAKGRILTVPATLLNTFFGMLLLGAILEDHAIGIALSAAGLTCALSLNFGVDHMVKRLDQAERRADGS
ncbi:MAG: hypothetical protein RIC85_03025 [Gammaproteobacteria bacterium]